MSPEQRTDPGRCKCPSDAVSSSAKELHCPNCMSQGVRRARRKEVLCDSLVLRAWRVCDDCGVHFQLGTHPIFRGAVAVACFAMSVWALTGRLLPAVYDVINGEITALGFIVESLIDLVAAVGFVVWGRDVLRPPQQINPRARDDTGEHALRRERDGQPPDPD